MLPGRRRTPVSNSQTVYIVCAAWATGNAGARTAALSSTCPSSRSTTNSWSCKFWTRSATRRSGVTTRLTSSSPTSRVSWWCLTRATPTRRKVRAAPASGQGREGRPKLHRHRRSRPDPAPSPRRLAASVDAGVLRWAGIIAPYRNLYRCSVANKIDLVESSEVRVRVRCASASPPSPLIRTGRGLVAFRGHAHQRRQELRTSRFGMVGADRFETSAQTGQGVTIMIQNVLRSVRAPHPVRRAGCRVCAAR